MEAGKQSEPENILWRLHPFHGIKDHLSKDDPRRTGTFSSNPSVLKTLGMPIHLPTLAPDETDLEILKRHYPDSDSANPPWDDIRADLLAARIPVDTVQNATSRDLVRMLERTQTPEPSSEKSGNEVEEPSDLYRLRVAAHECTDALYLYLHFAQRYVETGEPPEYAVFKGTKIDGPEKTREHYLEIGMDDPELSLECMLRSLTQFVNDIMEKHEALKDALEPVFEEMANIYSGLTNVCGFEGRSLCISLESFALHVVRYTFEGTEKYAQKDEYDSDIDPDDAIPYTASNWLPTITELLSGFPHLDIADNIHEGIEQELMDAWKIRLPPSATPSEPQAQEELAKDGPYSAPNAPSQWTKNVF